MNDGLDTNNITNNPHQTARITGVDECNDNNFSDM